MPDPRAGKAETHVYDGMGLQALDWVTAPPAGTAPNGKAAGAPPGVKVIPIAKKQPASPNAGKDGADKGKKGKGKGKRLRSRGGGGKGDGGKQPGKKANLVPRKGGAQSSGGRTVSVNDG